MENILIYRRKLDAYMDNLKRYFDNNLKYNLLLSNRIVNMNEDLEKHKPFIVMIDSAFLAERGPFVRRLARKFETLIYVVSIPDFAAQKALESLDEMGFIQAFISNSGTFLEIDKIFSTLLSAKLDRENYQNLVSETENLRLQLRASGGELKAHSMLLDEKQRYIDRIVIHDEMTGLSNYRYFQAQASMILDESKRYRDNVSLVYVRIDARQTLVELYGEDGLDLIVNACAQKIENKVRGNDIIGVSDDHMTFYVLYKKINIEAVRVVASRLKSDLEEHVYLLENQKIRITMSVGMASTINYYSNTYDYDTLSSQALIAMNNAIKKGGNTVVAYA